ncbi:hypothetical protein FGG08_002730 [Glutinoglossum americanum]|uniref:J domain-containing protein n=1 Tax=Glutinoglossum americanum TaxID=1670608 RepID=A0A9P8IEJ6_9PEZI|nr:hypothetical protein FGG08_002730 [Glutinoglossum americanum]
MSATPQEDPYKVLGVPKDATKDAIRSAHRKLVLQSHPDKVQDESLRAQKQDEFQRVQQAYELLIDESRRQQYDETVKRDELRRQVAEERAKSSRRYEPVRSSPREFDERRSHTRPYEDGRPRSFEDGVPSPKYDASGVRHPMRSFEGRKSTSRAEEEERAHAERERKRESERSERRKTRDRERRRGYDDKYARATPYYSEEDESHHARAPRESSKVHMESAELSGMLHLVQEAKLFAAQEYIRRSSEDSPARHLAGGRSHKPYYAAPPPPTPTPPIAVEEPSVRRSAARPNRERKRESSRPRSRGKESRIVDPPRYHESGTRTRIVPPMATPVSSQPILDDIPPLSGRSHHSHSRSSPSMAQTMKPQRSSTTENVRSRPGDSPSFSRSNTSPMVGSTSRRETVSGKLKDKVIKNSLGEAGFDSGYSSSTPDSPYLSGGRMSSSPPSRFEPRSSPKTGSFARQVYEEPVDYTYTRSRTLSREPEDLYERRTKSRSPSPVRLVPESSTRSRAQPPSAEFVSPRKVQYAYPKDSSRIPPISSRIAPLETTPRRTFTGEVHYAHKFGPEDVAYTQYSTPGRRSGGSHGHSHYIRPSLARAETIH